MKIILGIGNPGAQYAATRHNVGWLILDALLSGAASFQSCKFPLHLATWQHPEQGKVLLAKPTTYVNRSGQAAQALCSFYKVQPSDMLVVSDDIHLPLATLRIRANGSHGGHNGLRDIIAHLGDAFPRLRFGIDKPADEQVEHVLGRFREDEQSDLQAGIAKAVACCQAWLSGGVSAASRFNGPLHPPAPRPRPPSPQPATDDGAATTPTAEAPPPPE
ncbi:MAG: aminoacyl-tRNA hydrolase [Planctomycetota bacterium]|nr:MAG: aminoacyl-tRNA hydrolase [Planctomycetota bacterium]